MKKVVAIAMVFLMASSTFAGKFKMEDGLLYHDGELYTGEYKELFSNGKVASVFEFKQGIKDGEVVFYYDNGALKEKGLYKNGQKHDIWLRWDEEGNKIGAASFNNGMKDGAWKTWDAKGTLRYDMLYKNGEKVGLWTIYSENGEVLEQKSFGIN